MKKLSTSDGKEIIVDIEEYKIASRYKWLSKAYGKGVYRPVTIIGGSLVTFGKLVFNLEPNEVVFHKNGNCYDFRKNEIVICNRSELGHLVGTTNRKISQYKCVYYYERSKTWAVRLIKNKKIIDGGHYFTPDDAAIVADYYIILNFGEQTERNYPQYTFQVIEIKFKEILERYGETSNKRKAKSGQGIVRCKNKTSKFIGVSKDKTKWSARIKYNKKSIRIGNFENEVEAAKAYDRKAIELYGELARTNFYNMGI